MAVSATGPTARLGRPVMPGTFTHTLFSSFAVCTGFKLSWHQKAVKSVVVIHMSDCEPTCNACQYYHDNDYRQATM